MNAILRATETNRAKNTFYPTPDSLADKLISEIDWDKIESVLEPSAGKGNLAMYVCRRMQHRRGNYSRNDAEIVQRCDMDCIEIDPSLRAILEGRSFRVIHDDFLNFQTQKQYDLIVMNPPFDQGAEHLLRAIDIMKRGGIITCVLNAETIRNPYTNTRQLLAKELSKYSATIKYIKDAFVSAERSTDVDVALIRIEIPRASVDSTIMDDMKKAPTYQTQEIPNEYAELVRYNQIEEWVNRFNYETACGIKLIEEWGAMRPHILDNPDSTYSNPILELKLHTEGGKERDAVINSYIRQTRGKYWRMIFQQKTFMEKLTSNLQQELYDNVRELMDYDFSVYNILSLLIKMNAKVIGGVEETIVALFDKWTALHWSKESPNRHYYDGWATNDCFSIGKKVIVPFYGAFDNWDGRFRASNVTREFRDIEKVFDYLDSGRTDWPGEISKAFNEAETFQNARSIDTKYFTVTFYKKGTAHFVFKDDDLLEKFNLFAGRYKGWLPPCYGKKRYSDMSDKEKRVVDSFQGEARYKHVVNNAAFYLDTRRSEQFLLGQ